MNSGKRSWRWARGVGAAVGAIAASGYLLGPCVHTWEVGDRVYVRVGSGELALGRHEPPLVFDSSIELPWDPKPTKPVVWRTPSASAEWEAALPLWSIILIGAAMSAYAWRRCRLLPPGQCPACGYDLAEIGQGVCPECGPTSRQP